MRKKKIMRAVMLILFIGVFVGGVIGFQLLKKYMPSKEKVDLTEYFGIEEENEVAFILDGEISEDGGIEKENGMYISLNKVKELFNDRFYYDYNEDILLYTMPTETRCAALGDTGYSLYENFAAGNKKYEKD